MITFDIYIFTLKFLVSPKLVYIPLESALLQTQSLKGNDILSFPVLEIAFSYMIFVCIYFTHNIFASFPPLLGISTVENHC